MKAMSLGMRCWCWGALVAVLIIGNVCVEGRPHRILVDTDVDTDDLFALLYLLKLNTSQFKLEVSYPLTNSMQMIKPTIL